MLVARRDPPLHSGTADQLHVYGHPVRHTSRFMTAVQVISTLVAIPVGLASVYSIYRSNFTVEARCETLRGSIISMLDKSTDASTLRMLVRRDVVTFETNCGAVDPDAVKAFKALLAAKDTPKAALKAAPAESAKQVVHEPVRKPVDKPVEMAKPAAPPKAAPVVEAKPVEIKPVEMKPAETRPAATKPVRRDAETSDTNWINSVRDALTHAPAEQEPAAKVSLAPPTQAVETKQALPAPAVVQPPPAAPPAQARAVAPVPEVPAASPMSLAAPTAPALPEPVPVAAAPAPAPAGDHPVPPGAIPDAQPNAQPVAKPAEPNSNHSWLMKIPLVNRVVGD
jgi:hypothetical protein